MRRGARSWTQTSELPFRPPVSLRDIAVEVPPVGAVASRTPQPEVRGTALPDPSVPP